MLTHFQRYHLYRSSRQDCLIKNIFFLNFVTNVAVCILVGMFILVEVICANQLESEFLSIFLSNFALREINFNKGKMKTARVI